MTLHVEIVGAGPPLVLIHGWAMHGGIFAPLSARLAPHFQLHLVDLPGHGHSPPPTAELTLDDCVAQIAAATPPAPWIGWSLGGLVALRAALTMPTAVRGLVMLCASPRFVAATDWPHGVAASVFAQFAHGLRSDFRATVDGFLALEAYGSPHMRDELRDLRAQVFARGEPSPAVLLAGLHLLQSVDLRAALPALHMPSLWLAGRRDRLVDPRSMQAAAAATPAAGFVQFDGGHAPFLTDADGVADAIAAFADALSPVSQQHTPPQQSPLQQPHPLSPSTHPHPAS